MRMSALGRKRTSISKPLKACRAKWHPLVLQFPIRYDAVTKKFRWGRHGLETLSRRNQCDRIRMGTYRNPSYGRPVAYYLHASVGVFGHGRRARPWQASKRFLRSINNRTCRHYRRHLDFYFPCYALDITQTPFLSDTQERAGPQEVSGVVRVSRPGSGRFAKGDDDWRGR